MRPDELDALVREVKAALDAARGSLRQRFACGGKGIDLADADCEEHGELAIDQFIAGSCKCAPDTARQAARIESYFGDLGPWAEFVVVVSRCSAKRMEGVS